jgi:hypothetical protein
VFYKGEKIMSQYEVVVPIPDREVKDYIMLVKCTVKYIVRHENLVILAIKEVVKRKTTSMKV